MIILITGKAGCGKSTVANYLEKEYGFKQDQLAAPLKRCVADIFQIPMEIINPETEENRKKREEPIQDWNNWSARKLLQFIGTELFRTNISDDIWVRSLWLRISSKPGNWTIADVRFPNERSFFTDRLSKNEVVTIKVVRNNFDASVGLKGHASEAHDIEADFIVSAESGDLDGIYRQVDKIVESFPTPIIKLDNY